MLFLAEQLNAVNVRCFPCWARYNSARQRWDKGPAIPRDVSWQDTLDTMTLDWSSGIIGIPVPANVIVFDLDSYKGATRSAVETWLGASLDWDRAAIQKTISGGEHYAFHCPWPAKQGNNLGGVPGFDTRVAGKGFICSGKGYTPLGAAGVFALSNPAVLPDLPPAARTHLEHDATPTHDATHDATYNTTADDVISALRHIDPGGPRDEWVRIGMALRCQFEDDESTGLTLFDRWSSGEFWPGGTPENYVPEHIQGQWGSFKVEGGTTAATLFYRAIQGGWTPTTSAVDTSAAFGPDADVFTSLVERVRQEGGDIKQTQDIINAIQQAGCNALQVALLAAELKTELATSGLKDRKVSSRIDSLLTPSSATTPQGAYDRLDSDNAALFLQRYYPNDTLVRCDGEFYGYTGKIWQRLTADTVRHQLTVDMGAQRMQESKISACFRMVTNLAPVLDGQLNDIQDNLILFDNGVLNLDTGALTQHDKRIFTTNIMPYIWAPHQAVCNNWQAFLNDVFDCDTQRIELLQEWMGYLMSRDYTHQKIMLLLGGPRSGKGTIGRVLRHLIGHENFSGGSLSRLVADSFIDGISEKTAIFISDAQKRISPNIVNEVIERLKAISGNDEIEWHRMYHGAVTRAIPARLTIAANNIPALFDDSGALGSRLLLLTFDKSYLGREDLSLGDRLINEITGIAAWAQQGLQRLRAAGRFSLPAASQEELNFITEAFSPIQRFLREGCTLGSSCRCPTVDLYNAYHAWCVQEGEDLLRRKVFISAFKDATRGRGVHYGVHRMHDDTTARGFRGVKPRDSEPATAAAFQPRLVE